MTALPQTTSDSRYPPIAVRKEIVGKAWLAAKNSEQGYLETKAFPLDKLAGQFAIRDNTDLNGRDGGHYVGLDLEQCAGQCAKSQPDCVAVIYNKWEGWCFLKTGLGPTNYDSRSVLAVMKPNKVPDAASIDTSPLEFSTIADHGISGKPLPPSTQKVHDVKSCRESCQAEPKCTAFTLDKPSRECTLLSDTRGYYFDPSKKSGYKFQKH